MSRHLAVLFGILFAIPTFGQCIGSPNCTVKAAGGGGYTTIQGCATDAVAGDTCTVFAGTYNETPNIGTSGTGTNGVCTACITFKVNPGETVTTQPWNIFADYVIINGFKITDPTFTFGLAGVYIHSNHTGIQILNNTITQVGAAASGQTSSGWPCLQTEVPVHYLTIKGNTFSWCSALASQVNQAANCPSNLGNCHISGAIGPDGDHFLIQNNDISHSLYAVQIGGGSTYWAIIGNTWHDSYIGTVDQPNGAPPQHDALGCDVLNNCDTHLGAFNSFSTVTNILVENNTIENIWGTQGAHTFFASNASAGATLWITRFNKDYQVGNDYLANEAFTSNPSGISYWKDYNNSIISSAQQRSSQQELAVCGSTALNANNGSFINNLFYNDIYPTPGTSSTPYYTWSGTSCLSGLKSGYNLAFDSSCVAGTLVGCSTGQMASDIGNIYADPKLAATNGTNFNLQGSSPAIGAGTFLTTAIGAGASSTALTVADASYFQDGLGIPGVGADTIRVGASLSSPTVKISSINYSTNVITLASAISWSNNDKVYLYKDSSGNQVLFGTSPDIGAVQFLRNRNVAPAVRIFTKAITPTDRTASLFAKKGH